MLVEVIVCLPVQAFCIHAASINSIPVAVAVIVTSTPSIVVTVLQWRQTTSNI
jgi:hypothetical protein